MSRLLLVLGFSLFASISLAQLEVEAKVIKQLITNETIQHSGDMLYVTKDAVLQSRPGLLITIDTEASNIEIDISDASRNPVAYQEKGKHEFLVDTPGKFFIEVTAIDFSKNIYGKKKLVAELGSNPKPDPPGPTPDPEPPTPDVVPNEYGLGSVAYQYAPKNDVGNISNYANMYRRAADFLYGTPTLKFITSSDPTQNNDPNRSIMAWLRQQVDLLQCPDQQTCQQWAEFRKQLDVALVASQQSRQYTKLDWYNAFNEISRALELAK